MNKLYAAPMEGLTGYLWRQVHAALFGPADKYFTPFLSPNATRTFQRKELDEIDPAHNAGLYVVPQLLTNRAEHFLWAAGELYARGYREINFNLGCPAGTVAAKRKGSGLLAYPQELDRCLEEIFAGLPRGMSVSVKTRIGKNDPAEWPGLLAIYRKYPLSELIVHPRIQKEFYKGVPHRDAWAAVSGPWPAVYNGDIFTPEDAAVLCRDYPGTDAVMLGRGLMRDPALLRHLRGGPAASAQELRTYHDRLLEAYRQRLSGDQPVMHRMWSCGPTCPPDSPSRSRISSVCARQRTSPNTGPPWTPCSGSSDIQHKRQHRKPGVSGAVFFTPSWGCYTSPSASQTAASAGASSGPGTAKTAASPGRCPPG